MKHPKMPSAISLKISFPEKETNRSFFPLKINSAVLLKWPTSWPILMLKNKFHLLSSKNPCNSPITVDQLHFSIWKELSFQKKILRKEEKSFSRPKLRKKEKRNSGKSLKLRKWQSFVFWLQPREVSFPETN